MDHAGHGRRQHAWRNGAWRAQLHQPSAHIFCRWRLVFSAVSLEPGAITVFRDHLSEGGDYVEFEQPLYRVTLLSAHHHAGFWEHTSCRQLRLPDAGAGMEAGPER